MILPATRANRRFPVIPGLIEIGRIALTPPGGASGTVEAGIEVRHVPIVASHDQSFHGILASPTSSQASDCGSQARTPASLASASVI